VNPIFHINLSLPRADFSLDVDLNLPPHGITVLFGPSGSGKTSILRSVAGLETPQRARIVVADHVWQDDSQGISLPTHQRPLGYVFQEASLFEHLNVQRNLLYGLKRTRDPDATRTLETAITLLEIDHLIHRRVSQLSGGERQRVAIARALATQPRLLLLDEPMAALDTARRQEILPWLEKLRAELSLPMLYVTHSVDELVRLADHVVVLDKGQVTASGAPESVMTSLDMPILLGEEASALLHGTIAERSDTWHLIRVAFDGGSLWLRDNALPIGHPVRLRVMARDVSIATREPHHTSIQNHCPCVIESITPDAHPSHALLRLRCGNTLLLSRVTHRALDGLDLTPGCTAWAQVKSAGLLA